MSQNILKVDGVSRCYESAAGARGLNDISFSVAEGEVICILGQSGSGKSTLLRTLAGLEAADRGSVSIRDGVRAAYVSQEYTLWPNLTVMENLTLAPKLADERSEQSLQEEAAKLLARFDLTDFANSYPGTLSGGQRQRIALLRAVMSKPEILLLDEITSALDPELTKSVLDLVRALAKDGYTMVIITHQMSFAMSVADRIIFLRDGQLAQDVSTGQFFGAQSDPEIRSFILDIAKRDDSIEIFKGTEQYQAYHLGLIKRLPDDSTICIAGAVGDAWYVPMGEFYERYEKLRLSKRIAWKMVMYSQGETDRRLMTEAPALNQFRMLPRSIKNPANYNVVGDTVITQIFADQPTIIQIKNPHVAEAYMRFFEELWEASE